MTKILFRADGGPGIGMGHIMRCLALADAFPESCELAFIIRNGKKVVDTIQNHGYKVLMLDKGLDRKREIKQFKDTVIKCSTDILITDSYHIDQDYLIQLKPLVKKLVSIHDYAPFAFPSDIVLNGNIYAPELDYQSFDGHTEFLLGIDYLLLRNEFYDLPEKKVREFLENILITVGGDDFLNLTPKIIKAFNFLSLRDKNLVQKISLSIVIGPSFNNVKQIIAGIKKLNYETKLVFNTRQMSDLMQGADLAVSGGGSTLYELAVTGTPALVLLQADNQIPVADGLEKAGCVKNLGFGNQVKVEKIADNIQTLIKDYSLRQDMVSKGQAMIDTRGSYRAVKKILE